MGGPGEYLYNARETCRWVLSTNHRTHRLIQLSGFDEPTEGRRNTRNADLVESQPQDTVELADEVREAKALCVRHLRRQRNKTTQHKTRASSGSLVY